jgi:hypothetical protein
MTILDKTDYIEFLKDWDFNDEQIEFLVKQRDNYLQLSEDPDFDYDWYERDMWYTMNRSGLFEKDENNITEIYDWGPNETKLFITEL